MLKRYNAKLAYILANANRENEQAKATHSLAIDSLLASDSLISEYKAKAYSLRLLEECTRKTGTFAGRYQKIGFKTDLPTAATLGELPVRYRTVTRKYLRETGRTIAGEPEKQVAFVSVIISDTEDAEPCDFASNLYPVFAEEKREQRNHVRAESKYARRRLRNTTQETFNARHSEQVAQWLSKTSEEKREEILSLLESPLNPIDPHFISNVADSIWQKNDESIETLSRAGDCPTIRVSDWQKFKQTVMVAGAIANHHHWTKVGNVKNGDATLVLKANAFREYRKRHLLSRVVTPSQASIFEKQTGIDREDTEYLCRITGMGIRSLPSETPIFGKRVTPSERVAKARERMRAKRAAKRAAQANK